MPKKLCFVIMGFGKKTDPSTGNTLDLDQTYKNIIKPAAIDAGYECVRADEIKESGLIDKSMYVLLMQADLVIADISTYNPNALYELGIRHAVRPFSTIILKEKTGGKIPFDLDHNRMFSYTHLGEDIGADEAIRCKKELVELINEISKIKEIDSPLYGHIKNVVPPQLPEEEYRQIIGELADKEEKIFAIVERAKLLFDKENNPKDAALYWSRANKLVPNEAYFVQQLALTTYKSKHPTESTALTDSLKIITGLDPDGNTNDPETLGITGAIYKNLWHAHNDLGYLERATDNYGKGFKIRNDYYNGENYALCLNIKSNQSENQDDKIYYKIEAKKTRQSIIKNLVELMESDDFEQRSDKTWIYATLANCYFAINESEKAIEFETLFNGISPEEWQRQTYNKNKIQLLEQLN